MAIPFEQIPITPPPFMTGMQSGVGLLKQLQQMRQRAAMAPFRQQMAQAQVQQMPLRQQLMGAQIKEALAKAQQPFGGQILPGAAGRSQGIAILKQKYGEGTPIVQNAIRDWNADLQLKTSRAQYYSANTILKNLPQLSKLQIYDNWQREQAAKQQQGLPTQTFKEWYSKTGPEMAAKGPPSATTPISTPTTTTSPTPAEQTVAGTTQVPPTLTPSKLTQEPFGFESRQTGLAEVQRTVPKFVQQKLAFATNIEKTLAQMPDDAIKSYSENPKQLATDYGLSLQGKVTPAYRKYNQYITNAKMLATQIRQFYGDTVQPTMLARLEDLTNPINWRTNPKVSLIKFNALKKTLGREIQTYKDEATKPAFFQGDRESKVLRGQNVYGQPVAPKIAAVPQYSQEDLEFTARTHGITIDEVKRRLKGRGR